MEKNTNFGGLLRKIINFVGKNVKINKTNKTEKK